jgi:hypothetical protein
MKTIILISLFTLSIPLFAQETKKANYLPQMIRTVGATFQDFDELNGRIANFPQYKELPDHMGILQLGFLKEQNRVIHGLMLTAGSSMSGDKDERSSTVRFLGAGVDLGYNVLSSQRFMLYPLAGVGYEKYQAKFYKDNTDVDFNSVLQAVNDQNSLGPLDFKNSFFTYKLGAGFALKSLKFPGHSIGLQAGYIGSFKDNDWKSKENQGLKDSPQDKIGRVFVAITFMGQPKCMRH